MNARRLIGLILASVTLPLNVMRADLVCASRGHLEPGAASGHVSEMPDGMHRGAGADEHERQPCNTPSQSDCCEAVVACSLPFEPGRVTAIAGGVITHDAAWTRVLTIPSWLIVPPDPPPPRV